MRTGSLHGVLRGLQDLAYLGTTFTVTWLAGTAVTVVLVLGGRGLYGMALGWAVSQVGSAVAWWWRLRRRFPAVLPARLPQVLGEPLRDRMARGLWISVAQVAQVLLQGTDVLIIGKLLGPAAVVPYYCTGKVLSVLSNQPQLLAQTAQPALSELRTGAQRSDVHRASAALTRAILILSGAVACIVLAVNQGFVGWWVGPAQYGGQALTVALVLAMLLRHWNMTAVYSLFALGHDKRLSLTTLADGAVSVLATVVLTRAYGLLGAALGTIVGVVLVGLPANVGQLVRETGATLRQVGVELWPWAWRFGLAGALAAVAGQVWPPRTLWSLVGVTLLAGAIYGAVMLPLALREPLGTYVRPRLATVRQMVLRAAAGGDAGS